MKFLTIYSDYQGKGSGCDWIEAEDLEGTLQTTAFKYDNWADFVVIPETQVKELVQKIVDSLEKESEVPESTS